MDRPGTTPLRIGNWRVDPMSEQVSREGSDPVRVESQTLRLLLYLAERPGQLVSIDELLEQVWPGVIVTSDSVYQAVTSLRRVLGDDSKQPSYIVTVPRRGYRLVAAVGPWVEPGTETAAAPIGGLQTRVPRWALAVLAAALLLAAGGTLMFRATPLAQNSVAVLPFLDLTEKMKEEEFADGMTEELIDKLSKIPGLRVPSPTSSFYFKNKKITVPDVAKALGVAYVLDGSLRKSNGTLRVAARLVRADSGFVVWSETYDRRLDDRLQIQDDIANEVATALKASIGTAQDRGPSH